MRARQPPRTKQFRRAFRRSDDNPFGNGDDDSLTLTLGEIVMLEIAPQLRRLDAHDRVFDMIEPFAPPENLGADDEAVDGMTETGELRLDNALQKFAIPL